MRVLITGGTGLLGNNLLRQLSDSNYELTALVRSRPEDEVFKGIECRFVSGDVTDRKAIKEAVSDCDAVIHSAGLIQLGWSRLDDSMKVNRSGTRNLVSACLERGCPMVHIGTVNTLAVGSRSGPSNEETPIDSFGGQIPCSYVLSKRAGNDEVLAGVEMGLQAAIIHPGFMLGPWDWKPSSGRMVLEVGRRWQPVAPVGGCSVCDVRDVATGTIAAMHGLLEGRIASGRQYILAGENQTYYRLWNEFARRMGSWGPVFRAGPAIRKAGGWVGDLGTLMSGRELDINSAAIRMSSQFHWHDSSRAKRELNYRNRPLEQTLETAVQWIKQHFLSSRKKSAVLRNDAWALNRT